MIFRYPSGNACEEDDLLGDTLCSSGQHEFKKCFTVLVGLAALIALGICNKVVLPFLLVGHTHTDVDRIIGLVVAYIRRMNVATFEELKRFCLESFTVQVSYLCKCR